MAAQMRGRRTAEASLLSCLSVVLFALCLQASFVNAQSSTASILLNAGHFFREDLSVFFPSLQIEAVVASDVPSAPAWMQMDALPLLYGLVPVRVKRPQFLLTIVARVNDQTVTRMLNVSTNSNLLPAIELAVRVPTTSNTDLLGTRFADLEAATSISRARISSGQPAALFLRNILPFDSAPRNVDPSLFNPPLLDNSLFNSSSLVVFGSELSVQQLDCASLETAAASIFRAQGLRLDFASCVVSPVQLEGSTDTSRSLSNVEPRVWKRTRDSFDKSVLPASIIAGLFLVFGTLVFCIRCCVRSSDEELQLQTSRFVYNKMRRNRAHTMRVLASKDPAATIWLASAEGNARDAQAAGTQQPKSPTSIGSTRPSISSPGAASQSLRYRTHSRPPTYRPPPKHDF
eukprot:m.94769 g.94769  ORF g.94769 m.94769 type:complete len:403 (+) comp14739_c1_seq2:88-1296(+)